MEAPAAPAPLARGAFLPGRGDAACAATTSVVAAAAAARVVFFFVRRLPVAGGVGCLAARALRPVLLTGGAASTSLLVLGETAAGAEDEGEPDLLRGDLPLPVLRFFAGDGESPSSVPPTLTGAAVTASSSSSPPSSSPLPARPLLDLPAAASLSALLPPNRDDDDDDDDAPKLEGVPASSTFAPLPPRLCRVPTTAAGELPLRLPTAPGDAILPLAARAALPPGPSIALDGANSSSSSSGDTAPAERPPRLPVGEHWDGGDPPTELESVSPPSIPMVALTGLPHCGVAARPRASPFPLFAEAAAAAVPPAFVLAPAPPLPTLFPTSRGFGMGESNGEGLPSASVPSEADMSDADRRDRRPPPPPPSLLLLLLPLPRRRRGDGDGAPREE